MTLHLNHDDITVAAKLQFVGPNFCFLEMALKSNATKLQLKLENYTITLKSSAFLYENYLELS